MSAEFPPLVAGDVWSQSNGEPLVAGWGRAASGLSFAAEAMRTQRGSARFPWMALAAVSGGLLGAVAGISAVLQLAGIIS
jgi:hypothetical protein